MKIFYISSSLGTIYLMYVKFKATYDRNHDTFRIEFLLIPCAILALLVNHDFEVVEVKLIKSYFNLLFYTLILLRSLFEKKTRFCGRFRSIWSRWPFYHSCLWLVKQAKPSLSRVTIYSHSAPIELSTFSTGSTAIMPKASTILLP